MNETTAAPNAASKAPLWRRTWVMALGAGVLGLAIGAAGASDDPTSSTAYTTLANKYDAAKADLKSAQSELSSTEAELTKVAGDIPAREKAVTTKEAELESREAEVKAGEAAVLKREKKVGIVEAEVAANTIPGGGIYKVGSEMRPGTYKSSGGSSCYYAVLNSTDTSDIATNNLPDGPAFVTVQVGKYFETRQCDDWVLQR